MLYVFHKKQSSKGNYLLNSIMFEILLFAKISFLQFMKNNPSQTVLYLYTVSLMFSQANKTKTTE